MKTSLNLAVLASSTTIALAATNNSVQVPSTCEGDYKLGRDEVYYTVPYTYDQVMSIMGNYSNLTWAGSPDGSVTINGTDNTVGTARFYSVAGAELVETILSYSKPASPGPYAEVHDTATIDVPAANLSLYIPFDGTIVSSICDGKASNINMTSDFCSNDPATGGGLLHMLHLESLVTVGKFLGGENYTSCEALGSSATGPANQTAKPETTTTSPSSTGSAVPTTSPSAAAAWFRHGGVVGQAAKAMKDVSGRKYW